MEEIFTPLKNEKQVNLMSPLIWAYVGDSVYELYIRTHLINKTNLKAHDLHLNAIKYVKAKAQADILEKITDILTEEEKEVLRRARNVKVNHTAKNADPADYMYATAFEGLIGYLYLTKQNQRLKEILNKTANEDIV